MVAAPAAALVPYRNLSPYAVLALALAILLGACNGAAVPSPTSTSAGPTTQAPAPSPSPAATVLTPTPAFDSARALEHIRVLSADIGIRAAGTGGEHRAAEYIRGQLASYGYQAFSQGFTFESYVDDGSTVEVISPRGQTLAAQGLAGSPSATVEGEVINAGKGYTAEFPAGMAGKIALIQRGDISFGQKVANAAAAGAAGVIIYNNSPGPFGGGLGRTSDIPAVSISMENGQSLLAMASGGGLRLRITVRAHSDTLESQNVIAQPPDGICEAVAGAHYDSVPTGPGANDNASGTAVVLEMARLLAADGQYDPVCFVLFGAEEVGLLGSSHYVASLTLAEKQRLKGMLDFDMLAVGSGWPLEGSPELTAIVGEAAEALGLPHSASSLPAGAGSDHAPFIQAGIPAILFNCFCDEHYHTAQDTVEFIQKERLSEAGQLGLKVLARLLAP